MATKVDSVANMESQLVQTSVSSSPKVPKFVAKAGFVIPKNKLSGSLVPAIRGSKKLDTTDTIKDDTDTKTQRKTKWGADLTQDAAVRKGRVLAYQIRLEQITEQLKSGKPGISSEESLKSPSQSSVIDTFKMTLDNELKKLDQFELEKREVIGELLRLNPNYKAPADYKPLLKEANIPVPMKEYGGHNFIGLLLGPESNTQKRLEEETGTKVQVHGIKANTGEKCEITRSDFSETQSMFDELYVHISADTYEKVDAAAALIELLFKPITSNAAVEHTADQTDGNIANSSDQISLAPTDTVNQVAVQPVAAPLQSALASQPAYPNWYPNPPNVSVASPRFMHQPMPNNFHGNPSSSVSAPSPLYVAPQPSYDPSVRHPSIGGVQLQSLQALQKPMDPTLQRANFNVGPRPPWAHPSAQGQPVSNVPFQFPSSGWPMSAPSSTPVIPSSKQFPFSNLAYPIQSRPFGSSPGWSNAPPVASTSGQIPHRPVFPSSLPGQRPVGAGTQGSNAMPFQQNMPSNMVGRPQAINVTPASVPSQSSAMPSNYSAPQSQAGPSSLPAVASSSAGSMPAPVPPSMFPVHMPRPPSLSASSIAPQMPGLRTPPPVSVQPLAQPLTAPSGVVSTSGHGPFMASGNLGFSPSQQQPVMPGPVTGSFTNLPPVNSTSISSVIPVSAPKPPCPSPGDFTFQPVRNAGPGSLHSPRPGEQPIAQFNPTSPASLTQVSMPQTIQFLQTGPQNPLTQNMSQAPQTPVYRSANQFSPAAPQPSPVHNSQPLTAPAPQVPSFRPVIQNVGNPMSLPGAPRASPVGPGQAPVSSALHSNFRPAGPPRFPVNAGAQNSLAADTHRGQPGFMNPPQLPNYSGPSHARPNPSLPPPNQFPSPNPPRGIVIPAQQLGNNQQGFVAMRPASSPAGNQTYDPFSPTSIPSAPPIRDGQQKSGKPETDAEYEDLMASVGVR